MNSKISLKSCRICIIKTGTISLFDKGKEFFMKSYAEMLNEITNLKIYSKTDEELPILVCLTCVKKIEEACKLIRKCEESDKALKNYFIEKEKNKTVINECKSESEAFIRKNKKNVYISEKRKLRKTTSIEENISKNNENNPKNCNQCGKIFKCNAQLIQHLRVHSGEKPFNCTICSRKFNQMGNLITHKKRHENEQTLLFICEICSKQFNTIGNLKQHIKTHIIERNYKCEECPKTFRCKKALKGHKILHSGFKNHVCKSCGKSFYKTNYLTRHMQTVHFRVKNFKCSECDKEFSNTSNLQAHFRIHTGEKPFECKFCDAKFNQSSPLVRHTKQHLKKDPKLLEVEPV